MSPLRPLSPLVRGMLIFGWILSAAPGAELLQNGDMSAGETQPAGWTQRWVGQGRLVGLRDQAVFRSAPAALRVSAQDGYAKGQVYQMVPVAPGETLSAAGWVRCEGRDTTAQIAVQFYRSGFRPLSFSQVRYVAGNADWSKGSLDITVPAEAEQAAFVILVEGDGQAWLDDASLVRGGVSETKPAPTAPPGAPSASAQAAARAVADNLAGEGTLVSVIADFRTQGFAYGYEKWKDLAAVTRRSAEGLLLAGGDDGGAGLVYGSPAPIDGATHLRLRFIAHADHTAGALWVKLFGNPQGNLTVKLPPFEPETVQTRLVPLPKTRPDRVEQVQLQGDFSPNERFSLTLLDAAFVRLP